MKWILIPVMLITLAACQDEREQTQAEQGNKYRVECIDGVEYWTRWTGYKGYMAARVDPETLEFVRCSSVDNH